MVSQSRSDPALKVLVSRDEAQISELEYFIRILARNCVDKMYDSDYLNKDIPRENHRRLEHYVKEYIDVGIAEYIKLGGTQ